MDEKNKKQRKPLKSEKVKYHQGYYIPLNMEKCLTKENIYRSNWERLFMQWCDINPNILHWASEPIGIKYLNPVENLEYNLKQGLDPNNPHNWKVCTYYTDFWIEIVDTSRPEGFKRIFIEIKPHNQTHEPKPLNENASLKEHKAYNREALNWLVNSLKWAAAKKYFEERGAEFMVMTEVILKKLGLM